MNSYTTLEFDKILKMLSDLALSDNAKNKIENLSPILIERDCKNKQLETSEAKNIILQNDNPPLPTMENIEKNIVSCEKFDMLNPHQLTEITQFIKTCKRLKKYLEKVESSYPTIASYGTSLYILDDLNDEIDKAIRNGAVDDYASDTLKNVRKKIVVSNEQIKSKLESIIKSKKSILADSYVVTRNNKFVLPVKKECKNQINGTVIEISSTGSTYFIEPNSVKKISQELEILLIDEDNEVRKILYTLTNLVFDYIFELKSNIKIVEDLDFVFAKAKLSIKMNAIEAKITSERNINIINGRHPLLDDATCVALNFKIGKDYGYNGIIITGPNTGGKTVAIKTVGLLSLMAQCGLHVPVDDGSVFTLNVNVLCDIGDGQSIAQNLSTFSSHIKNIIDILKNITNESLVIFDELGTGTDPAEGMGIAIAILEELRLKNVLFVATTHYLEVNEYGKNTENLTVANMKFDKNTLTPLYELFIGEGGESQAIYISKKLGLPTKILNRAYKKTYGVDDFFGLDNNNDTIIKNNETAKIEKEVEKKVKKQLEHNFVIGDSVKIQPNNEIGIVFEKMNDIGEVGVFVKKDKKYVNHKRVKLLAKAEDLYPDDYDFSIIFDTVENRKKRNIMNKKHVEKLKIEEVN